MRDAALDVLDSTYPPELPSQYSSPNFNAATRTYRPPRLYKGKGKAKADSVAPMTPSHTPLHGFKFQKGVGYVCIVCNRLCPNPALHRRVSGGGGCVEFASATAMTHAPPAVVESGDHRAGNAPAITNHNQGSQLQLTQAQMQSSFQVQQMDMVAEQSSLDVQMEEQVPWDGLTVPVAGDDGSRLSQNAGLFF